MNRLGKVGLVALLLGCAGCTETIKMDGDELAQSNTNAAAIAKGHTCLAKADYECAEAAFEEIDPLTEIEEDEKIAGLAWSYAGRAVMDLGDKLIALAKLSQVVGASGSASFVALDSKGRGLVNQAIHSIISPYIQELDTVHEALATAGARADLEIDYERLPMYLANIPMLELRGSFDALDFELLAGLAKSFSAIFSLVLTADLQFELREVLDYWASLPDCDSDDRVKVGACIAQVANFLLYNHEDFLRHEPERKKVYLPKAESDLSTAATHFHHFFSRTDNLTDGRPLHIKAAGDGSATFTVNFAPSVLTRSQVQQLVSSKEQPKSAFDSEMLALQFPTSAAYIASMAALPDHLAGKAPETMVLNDTLTPVIATILEIFFSSDTVLHGTQFVAGVLGESSATVITDIFADIRDNYREAGDTTSFSDFLTEIIPESTRINLHAFLNNEDYLRSVLPLAVTETVGDTVEWRALVEYECDESEVVLIVCDQAAALVDAVHFAGTEVSLAADGIATPVPYIAFADPGLGGLLTLDPADVGQTGGAVVEPDLATTNALVRQIVGSLAELVSE